MRDLLSLRASQAAWICAICSLTCYLWSATANAQQETTSWTARGAQTSGSQHLFAQPEFSPSTAVVDRSTDMTDSIYRPQIPTTPDSSRTRVRPVSTSESDTVVPSVPGSSGILRSSHETLAAVPLASTVTPTAKADVHADRNTAAGTSQTSFYDRTRAEPLVQDSTDDASSGDLIQIVEALQWTVAVLALAVLVALVMKKYKQPGPASGTNSDIRHVATIPVRNVFQAHLLEIQGQQFLVTTDRNGVKTVTPVPRWDDFESPLNTIQETTATQTTGTLTS